jgi:hypothetical protein
LKKITSVIFYVYGSFGSQFVKVPFSDLKGGLFRFQFCLLNNKLNFFFRKLIGLKNGWRVRLKIVGRGFSFFKRNNFVYLNVGRSHIVRFFVNLYLRVSCAKKMITLVSKDFDLLPKISLMLITAQPPLLYKAKGLVYEFYDYKTRPGKIKQYRV